MHILAVLCIDVVEIGDVLVLVAVQHDIKRASAQERPQLL